LVGRSLGVVDSLGRFRGSMVIDLPCKRFNAARGWLEGAIRRRDIPQALEFVVA
jgi:hypothetical protein